MENLVGASIRGYQLRELIGAGAFGAVYLAHQAVIEREVAVKVIWPVFANHPNFIRNFETEAQVVAGLEHPYIVPLYDYWREPDGAYLVMRWLRGGHLRQSLDVGFWPLEDAARLLAQVAAALTLAHRSGVVHRDLKPENILLDEDGNAFLADFGIAHIVKKVHDGGEDLLSGMGSPAYAAPEQIAGRPPSPQADIYSLGLILFELLTGQHPFPDLADMSITELIRERTQRLVPPLSSVRPNLPPALNDVIQKATALDPTERYPDALSLANAFRDALAPGGRMNLPGGSSRVTGEIPAAYLLIGEPLPPLGDLDVIPNPYRGLRAFHEADSLNFFGREVLVQQLVQRLKADEKNCRFLAVVGPSGSGKSSVVRAGLIPALRKGAVPGSEHWYYVEMVPGAQPFEELRAALYSIAVNPPSNLLDLLRRDRRGLLDAVEQVLPPGQDAELFLLIDQFEEVFTLVEDPAETARFLQILFAAVDDPQSRVHLVITLRADFYDRPLLHPIFSELMRQRTEVVVPLTPDELENAIIGPAAQAGLSLELGLVTAIIADVNERPGALPLLQYTLSELFERREDRLLTLEAYRALGGVQGALARRAEELYSQFSPAQQEAARQLFLRLITLGEGTEDTRRRALLAELTALDHNGGALTSVIDTLGRSRLLTFDRDPVTRSPTVEVTHEALLREWRRLRTWLDASRNDVRLQRTLASLALEWLNAGRDASFLLRGARLDQYQRWKDTTSLGLTQNEKAFLAASIEEHHLRQTQEISRQERERALEQRARSRLRNLVVLLAVAAVVGAILTGLALQQTQRAEQERAIAERERAASEANEAISRSLAQEASARQAFTDHNYDLAIVLALEANRIANVPVQAQRALGEIAFAPGTRRLLNGHSAWVMSVNISLDGRRLISGSTDGTVRLWDLATGDTLRTLRGHQGDVQTVAFGADSRLVLSGAIDHTLLLWDVDQPGLSLQPIHSFREHAEPVRSVAFSPDGRYAVTGSSDRRLILWDVRSQQRVRQFEGHNSSVLCVDFSPDGRYVLSGSLDGMVIVWNVETGEAERTIDAHSTTVQDVAFSPDGAFAISASADNTIVQWDLADGRRVRTYAGDNSVLSVAYHPDGTQIVSGTNDGSIHVWNAATGEEVYRLEGHTDAVLSVDISSDGRTVVSGSKDRTIRVWDIRDPRQTGYADSNGQRVLSAILAADTQSVVWASGDGIVRRWDLASDQQRELVSGLGAGLRAFNFNNDGRLALMGYDSGDVRLLTPELGTSVALEPRHRDAVVSVGFSPDGSLGLSASRAGDLVVWNLATGTVVRRFEDQSDVFSAEVSPDNQTLLAGLQSGEVVLWNLTTGAQIWRLPAHTSSVYAVAISPDGTEAVTGSRDSSIILWDVEAAREHFRLVGHGGPVYHLAFRPDGSSVLSGAGDGYSILWDVATGREVQRFGSAESATYRVAFSPDGQLALAGSERGELRVWQVFLKDALIDWTHGNRYLRPLTGFECEQFLIESGCPQP